MHRQSHAMEYYLAIKRNKLLTHAVAQNLETIMLSINEARPKGCCVALFTWHPGKGKILGTEGRMVVAQRLGLGEDIAYIWSPIGRHCAAKPLDCIWEDNGTAVLTRMVISGL